MPQVCCVCSQPSENVVRIKGIDVEGAVGRPMIEVPYCKTHLESGQKFYEKIASDSSPFSKYKTYTRLITVVFVSIVTIVLGPDFSPGLANWHPILLGILGLVIGVFFVIFLNIGGGFYLFDNIVRNRIILSNKLEIPEGMKDSFWALGFRALRSLVADTRLEIELEVLNDEFASILEKEHAIQTLD